MTILQAWTEASSIPRALVAIILRLPRLKFAIVTLGKEGCIMLEKCVDDGKNTCLLVLGAIKLNSYEKIGRKCSFWINNIFYFLHLSSSVA